MSSTRTRSALSALVFVGAAALGAAGAANAALYTGNWDPEYGGIFEGLGWGATAVFDVPDACLALGNGTFAASGACADFRVLSAEVHFENNDEVLQSYTLAPTVFVNGIHLAGGSLTGVDTGFFDSFVSDLEIAGSGKYAFSLVLFNGNEAQLIYAFPQSASPVCAYTHYTGTECGISENAAVGVFAPIPEPETYALMLAGLGALGFAARRRRR